MRFSELDGKAIAVWGVGRETRSFANHLHEKLPQARLVAVVGDKPDRDAYAALEDPNLSATRFVAGEQAAEELVGVDVLVRSPGVSIHKPQLQLLRDRGVVITTATGLWLSEREGVNVIGVTGTKGKGTTAVLIAHLSSPARSTHLAGNIGRPVLDLLDAPLEDWVVLELSSFQISDLVQGPRVAVLTNLFKEHVDWHGSEAAYRREKLRLLGLPGVRAVAYRPGDPEVRQAVARDAVHVHFGVPGGWHIGADGVVTDGHSARIAPQDLPLRGRHNAENLCAALAALDAAGLQRPPLPAALAGVHGLPHRLETILVADGVEWVDDSIATNPASTIVALAAFSDHDVVLIAGGYERGQDLSDLASVAAAAERLRIICLPDTGARLAAAAIAAGMAPERIVHASDMADAVAIAREQARPGCAVLLSPAAASYNSYQDFEERGEHFAALAGARANP